MPLRPAPPPHPAGGRHGRGRRPRFGVNYTPRQGWWHLWNDPDPHGVREDFATIAGLGLDHVRLFLIWPLFQPHRTRLSPRAFDALDEVLVLADEAGLDVTVDYLQGHLSSFEYLPAWTTGQHAGGLFTDPRIVEGQRLLVRTAAARIAAHPNVLGSTLGNETNILARRDGRSETPEQIGAWLDTLLAEAGAAAPGLDHVHSEFDYAWLREGDPFLPSFAATKGTHTVLHAWVFGGAAATYGPLATGSVHFAEYLTELARSWHPPHDPGRTLWLQEVGAPLLGFDGKPMIPPRDAPEFAERTVRAAVRCAHLWGITWWCSHDVDRSLADFPELEYTLGLIDSAGRPKPLARRLARLVAEYDAAPPEPARRTTAVLFSGDRDTARPGGPVMNAFVDLLDKGEAPAVVRAEAARDQGHLTARGITRLVTP